MPYARVEICWEWGRARKEELAEEQLFRWNPLEAPRFIWTKNVAREVAQTQDITGMAVWPSWLLGADSTLLEVPASTRPTEGSLLAF